MSPRGRGGGGKRRGERPVPAADYYGRPIVKPPVWEEREIAGYLFTGGLAGASSILAAGADLTGRPALARGSRLMATGAIAVSLGALVKDLGRPLRFLNMLRVFKPTSPMSVGVWILVGYAPLAAGAAASDVGDRLPRLGRAAGLGAAALGSTVATYTAALIANTAVPAWHEGRRELPLLFAGSAASAAAGWGLVVAPTSENEPAVRMAVLGALVELGAEQLMERRLGMVAETLHAGEAGKRLRLAKALTAAGGIGAGFLARRNRGAAVAAGAALLAGSALTRFGLFEAGMASARDPKYTVEPQRARLAERRAATGRRV
ncbi:MAG TPA: NrfD/PsrC family molybdoenzyme membrane anchor subunit [Solirubrobacterales bacterium]|nr:NrfD/PsrC family molybdoenzyme membrane anchor subunit [Solirubrobacterales bacterium]